MTGEHIFGFEDTQQLVDGGGSVDVPDLLLLLASWGLEPGGSPDFDGDGVVTVPELPALLSNRGSCP